ncbi:aspartate aminotransferase family protein [Amphritea sp. 1_MG-2023]|uniref:aspartate aminotransferase family protein n=1 Tax=Amphritea sp. 1_MG-2023 TaxID=3062670 RepID=UPI0026E1EC94|nr:aspartate aminotransferase family protein [Amphritea sp. 1_MG-2023]MDO6563535.1 aspartate aminotransferase family protein [Amphritea sp. 1_MG-2023]
MNDEQLQQKAKDHLWMHFTRMGYYQNRDVPIISHGEGCYVYDTQGKKYLDGLAGLFTSQLGHGRKDIAKAVAEQTEKLGFFPIWCYAHPGAIELASRIAEMTPGDLNRVFFTSGGGESVEAAWKLARQYFAEIGQPRRYKVISRNLAYHGTSLGALSINGATSIKNVFEPLVPGARHVENTDLYRCNGAEVNADSLSYAKKCALDIERAIEIEGPETVAAVFLEPIQNVGGCIVPPEGYFQEVRKVCDKYGVLLVSDEVICAFGRLGYMFGCERFDYMPDIITCAKGLTSGFVPMGAMICRDFLMQPFLEDEEKLFLHGSTFGGHPVACAAALASLDAFEAENVLANVRENEAFFKRELDKLLELPIVGDVRGAGYFYGIELVKNKVTKEHFSAEESENVLFKFLSPRLYEEGLMCRTDDRGEPVIQLSPPLVAGREEISEMARILYQVIAEASELVNAA